jgi:hypothetical protein
VTFAELCGLRLTAARMANVSHPTKPLPIIDGGFSSVTPAAALRFVPYAIGALLSFSWVDFVRAEVGKGRRGPPEDHPGRPQHHARPAGAPAS